MKEKALIWREALYFAQSISSHCPVDLNEIAESLGVTSVRPGIVVGSAKVEFLSKGPQIIYSSRESLVRRRFSIAHELGHIIIHRLEPQFDQRNDFTESLCDQLAAELLMPADAIRTYFNDERVTAAWLFSAAEAFQVSSHAMAVRCSRLFNIAAIETYGGKRNWAVGKLQNLATKQVNDHSGEIRGTRSRVGQLDLNDGCGHYCLSWLFNVPKRIFVVSPLLSSN